MSLIKYAVSELDSAITNFTTLGGLCKTCDMYEANHTNSFRKRSAFARPFLSCLLMVSPISKVNAYETPSRETAKFSDLSH